MASEILPKALRVFLHSGSHPASYTKAFPSGKEITRSIQPWHYQGCTEIFREDLARPQL